MLDYSSNKSKPIIKFLDKITQEDTNNTKIINVNPNITYINVSENKEYKQESLDINLDKFDFVIKVFEQNVVEQKRVINLLNSNFFILICVKKLTKIDDLKKLISAVTINSQKSLSNF